jgi:glycosyltransferase involved in cell wall biosynthesis
MRTEYGDDDVSLVLNSVDTEQFYAPKRTKQPVPTVGVLYHTMVHKGWDVSFKALQSATERIPTLKVLVFGAHPPSPDFPLPPGAEYAHRPAQDKIREIYAHCDVWLCGSHSEGFHLPPLEAMACRCPVVSTAVGGPMDVINNGVNGYVVPVGDYQTLADRLVDVLESSPSEWQALSDAAYATATQYTWDEATRLFEQSLHAAIQKETSAAKIAA